MKTILPALLRLLGLKVVLLILLLISVSQLLPAVRILQGPLDGPLILGAMVLLLTGTISAFASIVMAVFYFRALCAFFGFLERWPGKD